MARKGAVDATIKVHGLRELQRDAKKAGKETDKETREGLKEAGEPVRDEWRRTFSHIHLKSASKLRVRAVTGRVLVDQPLRKTTGDRPDFAALQTAHGERALEAKANEAERILERHINDLADTAEGRI